MRSARAATAALLLAAVAAMTGCSHSDEDVRPATTPASSDVSNIGMTCDSAVAHHAVKPATVSAVKGWRGTTITVCLMGSDNKSSESMEQVLSSDDDINNIIQGSAETAKDRPVTCHPQKDPWTMIIDQSGKAWRLTPLECITAPGGSATPNDEKTPA